MEEGSTEACFLTMLDWNKFTQVRFPAQGTQHSCMQTWARHSWSSLTFCHSVAWSFLNCHHSWTNQGNTLPSLHLHKVTREEMTPGLEGGTFWNLSWPWLPYHTITCCNDTQKMLETSLALFASRVSLCARLRLNCPSGPPWVFSPHERAHS